MTDRQVSSTITLRALDAGWNYARWENELPDDGNRYEVIAGVLYMTTAPSFFHQWIIRRLDRYVGVPLEQQGPAYAATAPVGLLMPGCDPVQPDFVLIAEVLSPGNPEQDTETKRHAYARAGLPEYWIIRPHTRDVLVCHAPDTTLGDYTTVHLVGPTEMVSTLYFPVTLTVADLFVGAPDTAV
jgi:Uma2 family endonuclease